MHYHKGFWSSQEKELKILQVFLCFLSKSPHSIEHIIKEVEQMLFTTQEIKNAPLDDTGICLTNSGQELRIKKETHSFTWSIFTIKV